MRSRKSFLLPIIHHSYIKSVTCRSITIASLVSAAIIIEKGSNSHKNNQVVTESSEYIKGVKIWNTGIMEDPVPGEKRGKGIQHLNSSYWLHDLARFIYLNFDEIKDILQYGYNKQANDIQNDKENRNDFIYFINQSNALFMKAENLGLQTKESRDYFLMAAFLAMCAAEVDNYCYSKYNIQQREIGRDKFYKKYLETIYVQSNNQVNKNVINEMKLNKYYTDEIRVDLIPAIALERLGIHNELCGLKWGDSAVKWKTDGFKISKRIDSIKRHFDGVHNRDFSEDHVAHLIWGFMAVYHVLIVFPQMNDLPNFEEIRLRNMNT